MPTLTGRGSSGGAINEQIIDSSGRAHVEAATRTLAEKINQEHQAAWSIPFEDRDPMGADDYFLFLQNTGSNDLHVTAVQIESTVAGSLEVHRVTGAPVNSTAVTVAANTVVNRTLGNTRAPDAVMELGVNITGLTVAGILHHHALATADQTQHIIFIEHIIIPQGQSLALLWDTGTGILSGAIDFFELVD